MNITILTIGSRGDVQPFVALGVGLKEAGHRIVAKLQTQGTQGSGDAHRKRYPTSRFSESLEGNDTSIFFLY